MPLNNEIVYVGISLPDGISLPSYASCLIAISVNNEIGKVKKPHFCRKIFFRIIFTSINFFYQRFKIFINKWCFIRFTIFVKLES